MSLNIDTYLIPSDSPLVAPLKSELQLFNANVTSHREEALATGKKPTALGPPTPHLAAGFLSTLRSCNIGENNQSEVDAFIATTTTDVAVLKETITHIRLEETRTPGTVKLQVTVTPGSLHTILCASMAQL